MSIIFKEKIHKISEELRLFEDKSFSNIGLLGGATGIAIFHAYYAVFTKNEEDYDYAYSYIEKLVNSFSSKKGDFAYSYGLAGLGWALNHLIEIDFIDIDINDIFGDIDVFLEDRMLLELKNFNYDFFHGGLGVLNYFLVTKTGKELDVILEKALSVLEGSSVVHEGYVCWQNYDHKRGISIKGDFNLGLAHGMPGILSVLCLAYQKCMTKRTRIMQLVNSITDFLLYVHDRYRQEASISFFGNSFGEHVSGAVNSRLGWCYGDLGVALSIYSANQILHQDKLNQLLDKVLLKASVRLDISENRVFDAGLCHGSAGIAHIFNQFFKRTGNERCRCAADYWYKISLQQGQIKDGLAGYKSFEGDKGYVNDYGFLCGISGIGLAYISFLTNEDKWDRSLLINI